LPKMVETARGSERCALLTIPRLLQRESGPIELKRGPITLKRGLLLRQAIV
jgi:hypothetical protein